MDKESIYELQKIDCNCNDCKFMTRDFDKFKQSKEWHYNLQHNYYTMIKHKTNDKSLKFEFDSSACSIHYGKCSKLSKNISFIPNTCQLNTQTCFEHRKS